MSSHQKRVGFGHVFRMPSTDSRAISAGSEAVTRILETRAVPEEKRKLGILLDKACDCTYFVTGDDAGRAVALNHADSMIEQTKMSLPCDVKFDERTIPDKSWRTILPQYWQDRLASIDRRNRALNRGHDKELSRVKDLEHEHLPIPKGAFPVPQSARNLEHLEQLVEMDKCRIARNSNYPAKRKRIAILQEELAKARGDK